MKKKLFVLFMAVLLIAGITIPAAAEGYDAYFYTFDGNYKESAPIFVPKMVLGLEDNLGVGAKDPRDVFATDDGLLYVLDSGNNRIMVFDSKNNYEMAMPPISSFSNPYSESGADEFNAPGGMFVTADGSIYVADTGNSRVVVLDADGNVKNIIQNPTGTGITDDFIFQPSSVAVDVMGNVYTVSSSSNMGLLVFNSQGDFQSFLGAQTVTLSSSEIFWRIFQTAAQKAKTAKSLPANYDSVAIDNKGFLYVTSAKIDAQKQYAAMTSKSTASDYAPIKKLNPSGKDVLTRAGFYPPAGDLALAQGTDITTRVSRFVDCDVNKLGIYTAIETTSNHIFTYDADGNLLCAFGGQGNAIGRFSTVTAVSYCGNDLVVLDKNNATATVFTLSDFGKELFEALRLQSERQYTAALAKFEQLLPLNANMDFIYVNMGKSYMKNGEYDKAMEYFRSVSDKEDYSDAYKLSREDTLNKIAIFIPIVAILLIWVISILLKKINKLNKVDDMDSQRTDNLWHQILYAFRLLTNPLDGAYELKRSKRGTVKGATVILAVASAVMLFKSYVSGYIFVSGEKGDINPITVVLGLVLPVLVFCAGNWCVTSLMYGNGTIRDIYCITCYALLPIILFLIPTTILTNFLTLTEGQILTFVEAIAYAWTILIIFLGVLTIHGYGFFKNILGVILSLVGMIVIVFLALLIVILTFKVYSFFDNLITEFSYRI